MWFRSKMTSLYTVVFTGTSSILQANFLPEITLDENSDYSCALIDLFIKNTNNADKIVNIGEIRINCDIISGSYINGQQSHTIHQFATSTSDVKGQIFVEIPKHLIYFPIKVKSLRSIQISIVDHKGEPINIYGGEIICRINIKRDTTQIN